MNTGQAWFTYRLEFYPGFFCKILTQFFLAYKNLIKKLKEEINKPGLMVNGHNPGRWSRRTKSFRWAWLHSEFQDSLHSTVRALSQNPPKQNHHKKAGVRRRQKLKVNIHKLPSNEPKWNAAHFMRITCQKAFFRKNWVS